MAQKSEKLPKNRQNRAILETMPEHSPTVLTKIRTFAGDLETERRKRGESTKPAPKKIKEEKPEPKHQPASPKKPVRKIPKIKVEPKRERKEVPHHEPKPIKKVPPVHKPSPKPLQKKEPIVEKTHAPIPTKIPAFHELKKYESTKRGAGSVVLGSDKKLSSTEQPVPRSVVGYDTTIITDTKTERFRLFPSIIESIRNWFRKLSRKQKKRATPKYTVPETDRRKGVIQKATSKSGTLFTADNKTLKEQIRKRQKEDGQWETEEDLDTSWSPYTETGYNLLDAPDATTNVVVEYKKQRTLSLKSQRVTGVAPEPEPVAAEPTPEPEPVPVLEETIEEPVPEKMVVEPAPVPEPEPVAAEPTPEPAPAPVLEETIEEPVPAPEPEPITRPDEIEPFEEAQEIPQEIPVSSEEEGTNVFHVKQLNRYDTNALAILFVVMIVGFIAVVLLTHNLFTGLSEQFAAKETPVVTVEPLFSNTELISITLNAENLTQLPQHIKDIVSTAPEGVVEIPLVAPDGNAVTASYLFDLLQFHAAPGLKQSILSTRFVTVDHADPALIINFTDKDTVHGHLLTWEQTLAKDLQPLYAKDLSKDGTFTDKMLDGVDVRILRTDEQEMLVYGFIRENALLIAPNSEVFTLLMSKEDN